MKNIFKLSRISLLMVTMSLIVFSCKKGPEELSPAQIKVIEFKKITSPCIYIDGKISVEYNKVSEQIMYTEDRTEYMISNLTFDKYFALNINTPPVLNKVVIVNSEAVGFENMTFADRSMKVVEDKDGILWLWDAKASFGLVLRVN